jgi:hypothetical protein
MNHVWYVPLSWLIAWWLLKVVAILLFVIQVAVLFEPGQQHILPGGQVISFQPIVAAPGAAIIAGWIIKLVRRSSP